MLYIKHIYEIKTIIKSKLFKTILILNKFIKKINESNSHLKRKRDINNC